MSKLTKSYKFVYVVGDYTAFGVHANNKVWYGNRTSEPYTKKYHVKDFFFYYCQKTNKFVDYYGGNTEMEIVRACYSKFLRQYKESLRVRNRLKRQSAYFDNDISNVQNIIDANYKLLLEFKQKYEYFRDTGAYVYFELVK